MKPEAKKRMNETFNERYIRVADHGSYIVKVIGGAEYR